MMWNAASSWHVDCRGALVPCVAPVGRLVAITSGDFVGDAVGAYDAACTGRLVITIGALVGLPRTLR